MSLRTGLHSKTLSQKQNKTINKETKKLLTESTRKLLDLINIVKLQDTKEIHMSVCVCVFK